MKTETCANTCSVNFFNTDRWLNIHIVTAICCACLPIYKPLWTSISSATGNLLSRYATSIRSLLRSGPRSQNSDTYVRMGNLGHSKSSMSSKDGGFEGGFSKMNGAGGGQTTVAVVAGHPEDKDFVQAPMGSISYSRKVDIV